MKARMPKKYFCEKSSNILWFAHSLGTELVCFKSNPTLVYHYPGFPQRLHASWVRADSKGKFFHRHLIKLPCVKVGYAEN